MPKLDGSSLIHVEGLFDERLVAEVAAQINHSQVKKMIAVAKVTEVDKIALAFSENNIRVLEIAMDGGVGIGDAVDETA